MPERRESAQQPRVSLGKAWRPWTSPRVDAGPRQCRTLDGVLGGREKGAAPQSRPALLRPGSRPDAPGRTPSPGTWTRGRRSAGHAAPRARGFQEESRALTRRRETLAGFGPSAPGQALFRVRLVSVDCPSDDSLGDRLEAGAKRSVQPLASRVGSRPKPERMLEQMLRSLNDVFLGPHLLLKRVREH